jgi:hypothetical protein
MMKSYLPLSEASTMLSSGNLHSGGGQYSGSGRRVDVFGPLKAENSLRRAFSFASVSAGGFATRSVE